VARIGESIEKALENRIVERRTLPEIPKEKWDLFVDYAEHHCSGNWGWAFSNLIDRVLVEPEWLRFVVELSERVSVVEDNLKSKPDDEEDSSIKLCSGNKIGLSDSNEND